MVNMNHIEKISKSLSLKPHDVAAVIELLDEGNTVPFISRYRKERTGSMDDEKVRFVADELERLRAMDDRRDTILKSIEEQGKLNPALHEKILQAETMTELEDLYRPYKPKRRTRAMIAREKGLQGLADIILSQPTARVSIETVAKPFINEEVTDVDLALAGARDIVAETISEDAEVRAEIREKALKFGRTTSELKNDAEDPRKVYEMYYDFDFRVDRLRPHQILAINRGEAEKILRVKVEIEDRDWRNSIESHFEPNVVSPFFDELNLAIEDCAARLLLPAIERDVRKHLTEMAEKHAISVFADNLRALLGQPPLAGHVVMGIDPGYRTGSKVVVIDPTGLVLDTVTIYPHPPQNKREEALKIIVGMARDYKVTLVAIGNGTASRETEQLAADLVHILPKVRYVIVSEAGASVYSASPLARKEFPNMDVSMRGAVSIARRIQDPLAELVKIDPKSIGVGMYQHDVNQQELSNSLNGVVETVVNQVGVDVNTASPSLLNYVSGIGQTLAERVVAYREANGAFRSREELKQVKGLGAKAYEQSAGFLRIREGEDPLDSSAIHPESYEIARKLMNEAKIDMKQKPEARKTILDRYLSGKKLSELAKTFGCGEPTLEDILEQLVRPGRDPRENTPAPILRSDVLSAEDLQEGMVLKGTVRNAVDFGAFVDIGVKNDGLLHRSQIPAGVSLQVGDIIQVEILHVEVERGRISLGWGG
ncbi:MAG: RNA-binding transcriptional accessory protein [Anaerolineaceae bacterium]|nr:RNA-binding transcriptional accessory protein [Anaerolineaceae bacterium]